MTGLIFNTTRLFFFALIGIMTHSVMPISPSAALQNASGFEIWTDSTGSFSIEARFVGLEGDSLKLQTKDGSEIIVPLHRLGGSSAERARKLAGLVDEVKTIYEIRKLEKFLVFPDKIIPLYQRLLADEKTEEKIRQQVKTRLDELEQAFSKDQLWIEEEFVTRANVTKREQKAIGLLGEAKQLLAANDIDAATRKLNAASRANPVWPQADLTLGLIESLKKREHASAESNYREALKRCRQYTSLLSVDTGVMEIAILNNLALCELKQRNIGETVEIWKELEGSGRVPSPEISHNVMHAFWYADIGRANPNADFFGNHAKKLEKHDLALKTWAGNKASRSGEGWKYQFVPSLSSPSSVIDSGIGLTVLHDRACLGCDGKSRLLCHACLGKGSIQIRRPQIKILPNGNKTTVEVVEQEECQTCSRKGHIDCPFCKDGTEPDR